MKKASLCLLSLLFTGNLIAQTPLSIEKIMQGEKFTGFSPENLQWGPSGKQIYFTWNREMAPLRSLYSFRIGEKEPVKVSVEERKGLPSSPLQYNQAGTKAVYSKDGDLFLYEVKSQNTTRLTSTVDSETNPSFTSDGSRIIFTSRNNLYSWEITTGSITQVTDLKTGKEKPDEAAERKEKDTWLYKDQMRLFTVLDERNQKRGILKKENNEVKPPRPKTIYTGNMQAISLQISPDGRVVTFLTSGSSEEKNTIIPSFVTESGYTEDIRARSKVGITALSSATLHIYDIEKDTVFKVLTDDLPGINDKPVFVKDGEKRTLSFSGPYWSHDGRNAVLDIYSDDHKDRWIVLLDIQSGRVKPLDRQSDEAWIGGPGIRRFMGWLPDNKTIYFQSEETGYSHLYSLDVTTGVKTALTSGKFEVYEPLLSRDGRTWYFISNEADPGIQELYRMPANGGSRTQITSFGAGVEYELSPDEEYFALRVSTTNKPWELYLLANNAKAKPVKITESSTPEFSAYTWRVPEFVRFKGTDGTMVPARLYKPAGNAGNNAAVIFVHGAGYLQNVHRWWSSYFREYMFHNFLVDNGYTVLDIDYRGSAGYGRDWRTAIYRHMGGLDLQDHIDGARYLAEQHGIDKARIGIYGGSYGGFITLMALFTSPGTFAAGAALRPVTDWAHYNHGYTSNILNTPVADSIAYAKSSPIYYADGLKDHLLICHGMVDDNVHFQDVVRLSQRLIELGKDNWELAVYPVESHGFLEPSSWTDEYKRIFRLFEENLK